MTTTRADISHGQYVQEIDFLVRNILDTPGDVAAYEVEDPADEVLVIAGKADTAPPLTTGDRYRVELAFGIDTSFDEEAKFSEQFDTAADHECPQCGGDIAFSSGLETSPSAVREFLSETDRTGVHLVLGPDSNVTTLSDGDDWRPLRDSQPRVPTQQAEYQCTECTFSAPEDRLRYYLERGGVDENRVIENADMQDGSSVTASAAAPPSESLGMSTGGAKDADNFRENIEEGYLPDEDALAYEGLFYDYYFDTGDGEEVSDALFYPGYSTAVSDHPLTDETEHFLSVGLNSTLSVDAFERRRLNLVAVLDVSGSMGSQFDRYYYDEHGRQREVESRSTASKMEAATESLAALTTHLEADDRFGVVLYNSDSHVAKPLSRVAETDMDAIRRHIREVQSGGGTNMSAGLETAIDLLTEHEGADPTAVENRIVFMTDMMPNTGETGRNAISGTIESAANRGLYTTFVGMGIDANADLVESLSKVQGANHYFVHSAEEFEKRLDDEFEYMVTPLVFDLQLELDSDTEIEAVYGSPTADRATGRLMHVPTLFPSPTEDGESRGGVVLLKLADRPSSDVQLTASWEEIDGTMASSDVSITFDAQPESFETTGVQKAVCLSRYAAELREWVRDVSERSGDDWQPMNERRQQRGQWERESTPLRVEDEHRKRFEPLQPYVETTAQEVGDEDLEREVELLRTLVGAETPVAPELSEEARRRLRVLVDLAPTKNAELVEAWGLSSGSEVHQYLEGTLQDYYYRDAEKLIRPTDEATQLVEALASEE